jgi:hypothetical protein
MSYTLQFTNFGLSRVIDGILLYRFAVGTFDGSLITPVSDSLGDAVYFALVTNKQTEGAQTTYDCLIPASVGGWVIREIGLFDVDDQLIAYAQYPDTYKPLPSEGAASDLLITVTVGVSAAAEVNLELA